MSMLKKLRANNVLPIGVGLAGLVLVYLFQGVNYAAFIATTQPMQFSINKAIRVVLNDFFMLLLIAALFKDRNITKLALVIQAIDLFILLPIYLLLKLNLEGSTEISSPLLSQFHRLIVNPTFMILLIPAVYFQRLSKNK